MTRKPELSYVTFHEVRIDPSGYTLQQRFVRDGKVEDWHDVSADNPMPTVIDPADVVRRDDEDGEGDD